MTQYSKILLATVTLMIISAAVAASSAVHASDWPHWRGPFFNGSSDEKNLPTQWSTSENIAWSARPARRRRRHADRVRRLRLSGGR